MIFWKQKKKHWRRILDHLAEDRINHKSAAFAYYTLVALVPLLILILFVGGLLVGEEAIQKQLVTYFAERMGDQNVGFIENIISQVGSERNLLTVPLVFVAVSVFGIVKFFVHLRSAFFEIFGVTLVGRKKEQRLYITVVTFLTAMIFIILFTLITSAHIMTELLERVFESVIPLGEFGAVLWVIDLVITFFITITLLTLVYRMMSCYAISWRHSLLGAVSGAIAFIVLNTALNLYFSNVSMGTFYGAGGALIAFLLWVYSAGYVFFFGAEIAKSHREHIVCKV